MAEKRVLMDFFGARMYNKSINAWFLRVTFDLSALTSGLVIKNRTLGFASCSIFNDSTGSSCVQIQCYTRTHALTITCITCTSTSLIINIHVLYCKWLLFFRFDNWHDALVGVFEISEGQCTTSKASIGDISFYVSGKRYIMYMYIAFVHVQYTCTVHVHVLQNKFNVPYYIHLQCMYNRNIYIILVT